MNNKEQYYLERAAQAADAVRSAEALGYADLADAYRRVEMLWRSMAERAKSSLGSQEVV